MSKEVIKSGNTEEIRLAARNIVVAAVTGSAEDFHEAAVKTAHLGAGLDPDSIDVSSMEYRAGGAEALDTVLAVLGEATPDADTIRAIRTEGLARLLTEIATAMPFIENSNQIEQEFDEGQEVNSPQLDNRLRLLRELMLIEPAVSESDHHAWQLSPWGKQTYTRQIVDIAKTIGLDDALGGLRAIIENATSN